MLQFARFAYEEADNNKVKFWAPMPGPFCSSTRVEVAAGLLSLSIPQYVDVGTDSANFLKPLALMIKDTKHELLEKDPRGGALQDGIVVSYPQIA